MIFQSLRESKLSKNAFSSPSKYWVNIKWFWHSRKPDKVLKIGIRVVEVLMICIQFRGNYHFP